MPRSSGLSRLVLWGLFLSLFATGCSTPPEFEDEPVVIAIAPMESGTGADPLESLARQAMTAGFYGEAQEAYEVLAKSDPSPQKRAEFLFLAAESALGAKEHYRAYQLYHRLIRLYPGTPHFSTVIERIFLVARLYSEGKAQKPSWLMGIDMEDREFGIGELERFQLARERHFLADDALHYVGLSRVELREWELAIEAWERLARAYPTSEWKDTAEYRIGLTMLSLSAGPRYDKRPLLAALKRLQEYVESYPTGDHIAEAKAKVLEVQEELGQHQLDQARFYLRRDKTYAAILYLRALQREYPKTKAAKEAKQLAATLPETDPPPLPPEPDDLEEDDRETRLLLTPMPAEDSE